MTPDKKEYMQGFLAVTTVLGFFAAVGVLFWLDTVPIMKDTLLVMIGILGSQYREVHGYFFGASKHKQHM